MKIEPGPPFSEYTRRHLVKTYGEEFAELCALPESEYWAAVSERTQSQDTERDLINEIVPLEWAPTLAAARRMQREWAGEVAPK